MNYDSLVTCNFITLKISRMLKTIVFLGCVVLLSSCKKDNSKPVYQGVLIEECAGCSSEKGKPFYIVYSQTDKAVILMDTLMSNSIPEQMRKTGTRVSFNISSDTQNAIVCVTDRIYPPIKNLENIKVVH